MCVGNVLQGKTGAAMARMAQIEAMACEDGGNGVSVPLNVVNRQCSSGLQAFVNVADAIVAGHIDIGLACGVESMSFNPMHVQELPQVDWVRMQRVPDAMDCLTPMGITSENVSEAYGLKRKDLDDFAAMSHSKAAEAQKLGKFDKEIVSVDNVIMKDDGIRPGTTAEKLSKLRPVFKKGGSTTAGNSSQMTDGAAAVLVMSREEAEKRGLKIMGVLKSFSVCGVPPKVMGIGPAYAIPMALKEAMLDVSDIDVFEINEAFASQASWCVSKLGIDPKKVNPNGGAIALGHPLGCTGVRQITTLLHELERRQIERDGRKQYGVVSMCIGTGMGAAAVFEVDVEEQDKADTLNQSITPRAKL